MPDAAAFVISAVGLGAAYAAVPGAVNTEALRRGLLRGFHAALLVQTGSLVGDGAWAVVGLTGAAVLVRYDAVAVALGLAGAGFLFALARASLAGAVSGREPTEAPARTGGDFAVGLVFGLANPAGIAFWAGIGGGVVATGGDGMAASRVALFLAAFIIGASMWGCGMAATVGWGRRFVGGRLFRWVNALCGLALGYFGLRVLWSTLRRFGRWFPWAARVWT